MDTQLTIRCLATDEIGAKGTRHKTFIDSLESTYLQLVNPQGNL